MGAAAGWGSPAALLDAHGSSPCGARRTSTNIPAPAQPRRAPRPGQARPGRQGGATRSGWLAGWVAAHREGHPRQQRRHRVVVGQEDSDVGGDAAGQQAKACGHGRGEAGGRVSSTEEEAQRHQGAHGRRNRLAAPRRRLDPGHKPPERFAFAFALLCSALLCSALLCFALLCFALCAARRAAACRRRSPLMMLTMSLTSGTEARALKSAHCAGRKAGRGEVGWQGAARGGGSGQRRAARGGGTGGAAIPRWPSGLGTASAHCSAARMWRQRAARGLRPGVQLRSAGGDARAELLGDALDGSPGGMRQATGGGRRLRACRPCPPRWLPAQAPNPTPRDRRTHTVLQKLTAERQGAGGHQQNYNCCDLHCACSLLHEATAEKNGRRQRNSRGTRAGGTSGRADCRPARGVHAMAEQPPRPLPPGPCSPFA